MTGAETSRGCTAKPWRVWVALACPLMALFVVFASVGTFLSTARGLSNEEIGAALIEYGFYLSAVGFGIVFVVTRWLAGRDGLSLRDLGWRAPSPVDIAVGVGVGVVMALVQYGFANPLLRAASPDFDRAMSSFGFDDALLLPVAVIAEDTLYRGYGLTRLPARYPMPLAFVVTAVAYAFLSAGNGLTVFAWTVVMGVVFNTVFLRRRNLWPVAVVHYLMAFIPLCIDTFRR